MQHKRTFWRLKINMAMRHFFFTIFILTAFVHDVSAQKASIGASLQLLLHEKEPTSPFISVEAGQSIISLLIETHGPLQENDFQKTGVRIRSNFGTIATVDVPLNNLKIISELSFVKRIELPLLLEKQDTTMKRMTMVDKVHAGLPPLTKGYFGSNSLIGIIDDGIDFTHTDFHDSSGKSRVIAIWNMDRKGMPPTGFHYGTEIKYDSIEYYRTSLRPDPVDIYYRERLLGFANHGTPVAGLAAGKNGVAPGAAIAGVALTAFLDTLLRSDRVLDGINYLYQKALSIEKKCIINISLGTAWGGPHDGKTLLEKAIDQFAAEKPDLLIVSSAGNDGNNYKHWGGFPIHRDSSFNFFQCAYNGMVYVSIPRGMAKDISVSLTDSKMGDINNKRFQKDSIHDQTPFVNIGQLMDSNKIVTAHTKLPNGSQSSTFKFAASHYNEDYDELIIDVTEHPSANIRYEPHLYRLIFKGEGKMVHVYYPFLNLHPGFYRNPLPDDSTFTMNDNHFTTNIPTNAFSILSAGAYNLRQCYVNMHKKTVNQYTPCQLTYFTSRGPTFDGRIKPEVLAPGENVIAPGRRFETFFGHEFFLDSTKKMFGGTSASSPIIAGMAALLWEQFPNENPEQIKQRLKKNTYTDHHTIVDGTLPNMRAGWGKADVFKASTGVSTWNDSLCRPVTCVTTIVPNPDPPPIPIPITNFIRILQNPAENNLHIVYRSNQAEGYTVYDMLGRQMFSGKLAAAPGTATVFLPLGYLAKGYYFLKFAEQPAQRFFKK